MESYQKQSSAVGSVFAVSPVQFVPVRVDRCTCWSCSWQRVSEVCSGGANLGECVTSQLVFE